MFVGSLNTRYDVNIRNAFFIFIPNSHKTLPLRHSSLNRRKNTNLELINWNFDPNDAKLSCVFFYFFVFNSLKKPKNCRNLLVNVLLCSNVWIFSRLPPPIVLKSAFADMLNVTHIRFLILIHYSESVKTHSDISSSASQPEEK